MSRRNGRYQWLTSAFGLILAGSWCCNQAAARQPSLPGSANQKSANLKIANQKIAGPNSGTKQPQGKAQELTPKQRAVKEQVAARMKLLLQKFDVNRNGRLEPAEEQAARAKLMQQGANRGGKLGSGPQVGAGGVQGGGAFGGGAFGGGAFGGDQGSPEPADMDDRGATKKKQGKDPNAKQKLLAEFDADGNGKLDPAERKAAHKAAAQRKAEAAKANRP